jgi:hypothetical protein
MNLYNCSEQNASVRENFLVENTLTICILTIANNDKEGKYTLKIQSWAQLPFSAEKSVVR